MTLLIVYTEQHILLEARVDDDRLSSQRGHIGKRSSKYTPPPTIDIRQTIKRWLHQIVLHGDPIPAAKVHDRALRQALNELTGTVYLWTSNSISQQFDPRFRERYS